MWDFLRANALVASISKESWRLLPVIIVVHACTCYGVVELALVAILSHKLRALIVTHRVTTLQFLEQ